MCVSRKQEGRKEYVGREGRGMFMGGKEEREKTSVGRK